MDKAASAPPLRKTASMAGSVAMGGGLGAEINQYGSFLSKRGATSPMLDAVQAAPSEAVPHETFQQEAPVEDSDASARVSSDLGMMDVSEWEVSPRGTTRPASPSRTGRATGKEDLEMLDSLDQDLEEEEHEDGEVSSPDEGQSLSQVVAASAPIVRRRRTKVVPAEPPRKSARLHGPAASTPTLQKAARRVAEKNLEFPGTSSNPSPSFSVLQTVEDGRLEAVAHDSGLVLGREGFQPGEFLSVIRAKEAAQAALAQAEFLKNQAAARVAAEKAALEAEKEAAVGAAVSSDEEAPGDEGAGPPAPPQVNKRRSRVTVLATRRARGKAKVPP